MLHNLPSYIRNIAGERDDSLLNEMKNRLFYKPKGRPPYSAQMIRFALHLRYTSFQAYKLFLEKFPLPSVSSLHKIQGGVDALKAVSLLQETGKISSDCVLMIDKMYLQKAAQYQDGKYVGVNENGDLYKGILVFMIVGLTKSIPYVIQAIPQVTFTGTWLSTEILESFQALNKAGFIV